MFNPFQPLNERMINQFEDEGVINFNEPINGVIDDFGRKHAQVANVFKDLKFRKYSFQISSKAIIN